MKMPICEVCLKSDILCKACREKVESGLVTASDIKISRTIYELSKIIRPLKDVDIKKILESPSVVVIICKKGDGPIIVGKDGVIVKKLSKKLEKIVKIVEEPKDKKDFLQKLLAPVPVLGINVVYTNDGEILKIKIPKGKKPSILAASISRITKEVFNQEVEIVNE